MQETTISIDESLLERLRERASERRIPVEALIREALEEKLSDSRPLPRSVGVADSGQPGLATQIASERPEFDSWR